jgi:holo-ACP synthase
MSCAKLKAEILAARDNREAMLNAVLGTTPASLVFVSTALPGPRKDLTGSDDLFRWALTELERRLGSLQALAQGRDVLGPYAIVAVGLSAAITKQACVALEDSQPPARLLDLDIYGADGTRLGRLDIGQPARRCLLCNQPAADCIRLKRHATEELIHHAKNLLAIVSGAAAG